MIYYGVYYERIIQLCEIIRRGEKITLKKKHVYIEAIRIFAILCVMFNHSGPRGSGYYQYTDSAICYFLSFLGNIICNIGVPLFFLISGIVLLGKEESAIKVYQKRIPRILMVLVLFSFVRYLYECFGLKRFSFDMLDFLNKLLRGEIFLPYWYLYAYVSLLLVLPMLRKMVQSISQQEGKIYLYLCAFFCILMPIINQCGFGIYLEFLLGDHILYFVIGFILEKYFIDNWNQKKTMVCSLALALISIVTMYILKNNNLFCAPLTVSVYLLFRSINWDKLRVSNLIVYMGGCVFGVYLIEDYIRNALAFICDNLSPYFTPILACLVWLLISFAVGTLVVSCLKKLPFLRKVL